MVFQPGRSLLLAGITWCLLLPGTLRAQAADSLRGALLQQARTHNLELALLRAAVRSAASRVAAAGVREAPVLSAEIEEVPGGAEVWDAGQVQLGLEQELFTGRRRSAAAGVATVELRRHELALNLAERTLSARLDRELTRWRGQGAIGQRLALEDALLREVEEGLASRFATGAARYVDVLRVRTERLRVQSEQAAAIGEAAEARLGLILLAGTDSVALADTGVAGVPGSLLPPIDADSLFNVLEAMGAFALDQSLAEAEAKRALADRGIRFGGGIGIQRFGEPDHFTLGPALRVSASLPFAVGRSNAAVREATALAVTESATRASAQRALLRSAMRQAAGRYLAAHNRAQLFDAALLRGSRAERDAALSAYRTGDLTLIELLDFERALARAETDQVRAMIEARDTYADLFDLLRGNHE